MAKYLEVTNTKNKVVIDDHTVKLSLIRSGPLNKLSNFGEPEMPERSFHMHWDSTWQQHSRVIPLPPADKRCSCSYSRYIDLTPNEKLVAFRLNGEYPNAIVSCHRHWAFPTRVVFAILQNASTAYIDNTIENNIDVYIFGIKEEHQGASNCGLQIFNENGEIIYSSANYLFKPTAAFSQPYESLPEYIDNWTSEISVKSIGSNEAIVMNSTIARYANAKTSDIWLLPSSYGITKKNGNLSLKPMAMPFAEDAFYPAFHPLMSRESNILFCDISNIPFPFNS